MRYRKAAQRLAFAAFGVAAIFAFSDAQGENTAENLGSVRTLSAAECLRALDKTVLHINDVDTDTAQRGLTTLAQSCESVPQVHHNVGVVAAKRGQWETAIAAFEKAISLDARTSDTVAQLTALHEYQAKLAWQAALELTDLPDEPEFTLQSSAHRNKPVFAPINNAAGLRSVATVDFELFTWWNALSNDTDQSAWLEHYMAGYPSPDNALNRPVEWQYVTRDIRFTAQDAVVVLNWKVAKTEHHRMLMLTLAGDRWRIYHEADL